MAKLYMQSTFFILYISMFCGFCVNGCMYYEICVLGHFEMIC